MWTHYYKLDEFGKPCHAQMSYEPLINKERNVFCMNFDPNNSYQDYINKVGFIPEIVHELFDREVKYLTKFQKYSWAPEVLDIEGNKIYIRWYDNTCNDIINTGNTLPPNWKDQLTHIIHDQLDEHVYKITQYPHCFYVDNTSTLHTFDLHACFDFDDYMMPWSKLKGIIHGSSEGRIAEVQSADMVNMRDMFLNSLRTHIKWPDNYLNEIYKLL
jgi:hypothetical protein